MGELSAIRQSLAEHPMQPALWKEWAIAVIADGDLQKGLAIFSRGLSYNPFDAMLYQQRGRKCIGAGLYDQAISDMTLSARLVPADWETWYYMGVACNLADDYERSVDCFTTCAGLVPSPAGLYPVADWLYTTYMAMNRLEEAAQALDLVDLSVPSGETDYSYGMRVRLFKGLLTPEEFLDEQSLQTAKTPSLSRVTMLYGLACYYRWHGDMKQYDQTLLMLLAQQGYDNAFGYIKGVREGKERGLA